MGDLFATRVPDPPSFLFYVAQQLVVPVLGIVGGLLGNGFVSMLLPPVYPPQVESVLARLLGVIGGMAGAMLFGWSAAAIFQLLKGDETTGRWIWVVPTLLIILGIASGTRTFSFSYALSELFLPPPEGEAWWAVFLATNPAACCLAYSLTRWRLIRIRLPQQTE